MTLPLKTVSTHSRRLAVRLKPALLPAGLFGFTVFIFWAGYLLGADSALSEVTSTQRAAASLTQSRILSHTPTFTPSSTPTSTSTPTLTPSPTLTDTPTSTTAAPTLTLTPTATLTPTLSIPESGFLVLAISETARLGEMAEALIRTRPDAPCTLVYFTPSGRESTAAGVGRKSADAEGYCGWTWKIGSSTRPGVGTVRITAGGAVEVYRIEITN